MNFVCQLLAENRSSDRVYERLKSRNSLYGGQNITLQYFIWLSMTNRIVVMAPSKYNHHVEVWENMYSLASVTRCKVMVKGRIVLASCPPLVSVTVLSRLIFPIVIQYIHVGFCRFLDPAGRYDTLFVPSSLVQEKLTNL